MEPLAERPSRHRFDRKFHYVGDPRNSQPKRPDGHRRHRPDSTAYPGRDLIGFGVQDVAFRRGAVFGPDLLDMD